MRSYNFAPRKERLILAHLGRGWRGFREVVTFLSGERREEWTLQEREESLIENNDGCHGNIPPRYRPPSALQPVILHPFARNSSSIYVSTAPHFSPQIVHVLILLEPQVEEDHQGG